MRSLSRSSACVARHRPLAAPANFPTILGAASSSPSTSLARRRFSDYPPAATQGEGKGGRLGLAFAVACLPHPDKVHRGGEDGYFASARSRSFGVADGVGGYAESGVDPGAFARQLLKLAVEVIDKVPSHQEADLTEALRVASATLKESKLQGGTTALLGQLNGAIVTILNLGDSGAMILRPALRTPPGTDKPLLFPRVVFRSRDQTHYFNCPYQIGSGTANWEVPDFVSVRVRAGDIVVAGSDGVFDNLFDHQVQAIVARHLARAWNTRTEVVPQLSGLAMSIAKQAQRIGQQEDHKDIITPFTLSAHSEGLSFPGGKLDDTTVVIGLVCSEDEALLEGSDLLHNFQS